MRQQRKDYGFHGYSELCHFVYCLLLRTREIESLPGIHDWEAYMDVKKMSEYPAASMETFLDNCDFGRELLAGKTSEAQEFRRYCRDFLDQLVTVILNSPSVSSVVAKGLCSFSPEILLEGDAHSVFTLFADLTGVLVSCGILSSDDSNAAIAQFSSYVVEKRRWHEGSDVNASEIPDVVRYLLQDFSFVARPEVCRVLKLCCLIVGVPAVQYPPVSFDLSGCALSKAVFHDCVRLVQSYVLCAGYEHQVFFTDVTLDAVRDAIVTAGIFYITPGYDLWKNYCDPGVDSFIANYRKLYSTFLLERRKSSKRYYVECNRANRRARGSVGASGSETGSNVSGASKKSKSGSTTIPGGASGSKSVKKVSSQSSHSGQSKKLKSGTKGRKKDSSDERDPDVVHRVA